MTERTGRLPFPFHISRWHSQSEITITPEGRHLIQLPREFPLAVMPLAFTHGYRNTPNYHDYLEISWIAQGRGTFRIAEKLYPVEPGDIFLNGNTEFHLLESTGEEQLRVVSLYFLPELIYRPGGTVFDFEYLKPFFDHSIEFRHRIPAAVPSNGKVVALMARASTALEQRLPHHMLDAKNALCELLLELARYYGQFTIDERDYPQRRQRLDRLQNLFRFLQESYQERLTLDRLAQVACMSPSYLCRYFKQTTSYTLREYLQRIRIDRAKELLVRGNLPITQVGLEVGFESHSYFDRVFRKLNGVSPSNYCERFAPAGRLSPPNASIAGGRAEGNPR